MTIPDLQPADEIGSPNGSRAPLERVENHELPEQWARLIEEYEDVVGDRNRFLWKWAHHLFPKFALSSVAPEYVKKTQNVKLAGLMFVSILDDIAEKHDDHATFEEASKIPFEHQSVNYERSGVDREALTFANEIWTEFSSTMQNAPRVSEFEEILRFDLKQVLNAMEYSSVANRHLEFITRSELQTYDAHNMMLFGFIDIDLFHSPTFDRSELASLRQVVQHAQRMVRIGNWVTTWERELSEGDFTSGIVAYALEQEIVSPDDLRGLKRDAGTKDVEALVKTLHDREIEAVFLQQWDEELAAARQFEDEFDSLDIGAYLDGIETVMEYHLASRGLK